MNISNMQANPVLPKPSPKSNRLTIKKPSSARRSQKSSTSPKERKNALKQSTPKAVPRLQISTLFTPRTPRKANPSSSRSRRKSSKKHNKTNSMPNGSQLLQNSSEKRLISEVPTSQLLSSQRKDVNLELVKTWEEQRLPVSPSVVLQGFSSCLSKYEESEVLGYHEIFCIGVKARKSKNKVDSRLNYGFDDERGDYKVEMMDHIAYRYEILKVLGSGSFGQVLLVKDHKTQKNCALKIIRNKARFHQQALVEVEILKVLSEKDSNELYSVVHIIDHLMFRKHMCIVFELLHINLYELLKTNDFNGLSNSLIRRFANQIAQALKLLARYQIIHCDLKPENILLKQANRSTIKVIDFGSSCFYDKRVYTYIQSRFYRAPEIILGIPYTTAIDVWSLGCILVELHTGYPMFPGESEAEQIVCIMEVFGLPPKNIMKQATRASKFFDSENIPKNLTNSRGKTRKPGSKNIENILKGAEPGLVDIVKRCLDWDPVSRINPDELLSHPWMKENRLSSTKNFNRGGSSQPHQGKHESKFSFDEAQLSIRNSFLAGSCKNKKIPAFVFEV
jgi:dual specificity tyrosine-phosphorylation-regulated kinase 2/3/4